MLNLWHKYSGASKSYDGFSNLKCIFWEVDFWVVGMFSHFHAKLR